MLKRAFSTPTGSSPGYSSVQRSWCGIHGTTNILIDNCNTILLKNQ
nr:MAG TPA: hypothetical protein [Bacteriophage sp.]